MADKEQVTQLFDAIAEGSDDAVAELWEAVHCEVHQMAVNS